MTVFVLKSVEVKDEEVLAYEQEVEENRLLGKITSSDNLVLGSRTRVRQNGDWLGAGLLHIESGAVRITFDNGASTLLEGPALLDLESPDRIFLRRGRLTADVPPPAVGFVVNTPKMNVVDLGTRFGVAVEPNGDTELHVMEGLVEASRVRGHSVPVQLREGLSVKADGRSQGQLQPIEYGGDRYRLRIDGAPDEAVGYVRYRFDEGSGPYIGDDGYGIEGGPFDSSLLADGGSDASPRRTPGRVGDGLVFRVGESLQTSVPSGMAATAPHSIAFWVKLPPKAKRDEKAALLSLGAVEDEQIWKLSWNTLSTDGPVGALRVDIGGGHLVGTTDLRDGRWHHVVSRFAGGEGADVATDVRLYVDGQLESVGGFRSEKILPAVNRSSRTVLAFGRENELAQPLFEGWIDEFVLFDDAIDPVSIYEMATIEGNRQAAGAE